MTDPHRDYPTPSETIAALEARIAKLELVCAEKSKRCTEAVAKMGLANAESARLRELLQELTWSSWQLSGDLKNRTGEGTKPFPSLTQDFIERVYAMQREELIVRVLRQAETIAQYQKQKAGDVHNGQANSLPNRSRPIFRYGDEVQLDFRGKCPEGWELVWDQMKLFMDNQSLLFMEYADEAVGIVKWKSECWNVPTHRLFFPSPVETRNV